MTNYFKKRKRQNGRQESGQSTAQRAYQKGYFEGQGDLISRFIAQGILPPINFDIPHDIKSISP